MTVLDFGVLLGGLSLFLYGMLLLEENLGVLAGDNPQRLLGKWADSPLKGMLVGSLVTALIQSSSAVTVMVVGLVDAGLLRLEQTVGIILGANIGTTFTAWIFGKSGEDSVSLPLYFLNPQFLVSIAATAGVAVLFLSGREKMKKIANIPVGFAILVFGMETMTEAVSPLRDVPAFTGLLLKFSNPFWGILAGALLTAVIQSSSASVSILQALCTTGAVRYDVALPIVLGQNIGTCATALLSGVGAGVNARRAARIHLYSNVLGAAAVLVVLYPLHRLVCFSFMEETATGFGIAVIHSSFNLITALGLLPFSRQLVWLSCLNTKTIPRSLRRFSG